VVVSPVLENHRMVCPSNGTSANGDAGGSACERGCTSHDSHAYCVCMAHSYIYIVSKTQIAFAPPLIDKSGTGTHFLNSWAIINADESLMRRASHECRSRPAPAGGGYVAGVAAAPYKLCRIVAHPVWNLAINSGIEGYRNTHCHSRFFPPVTHPFEACRRGPINFSL
jgi:hypothetical protein